MINKIVVHVGACVSVGKRMWMKNIQYTLQNCGQIIRC